LNRAIRYGLGLIVAIGFQIAGSTAFADVVTDWNVWTSDGVHYRNSTEVGSAMGKQVGELVAAKYLRSDN